SLQQSGAFHVRNGSPLASLASPGSDLRDTPAPQSRRALSPRAETYGILTLGRPIRNRKLMPVGAKSLSSKEANMLDFAFVALGLAALALMGVYALALRQL
ncbi:MAG TPA: hypothetical protein VIZ19_03170, partial [Roseiarcus sp.]